MREEDKAKIYDEISKGRRPNNLQLRRIFPEMSYHEICCCCAALIKDGKIRKVQGEYPNMYEVAE